MYHSTILGVMTQTPSIYDSTTRRQVHSPLLAPNPNYSYKYFNRPNNDTSLLYYPAANFSGFPSPDFRKKRKP